MSGSLVDVLMQVLLREEPELPLGKPEITDRVAMELASLLGCVMSNAMILQDNKAYLELFERVMTHINVEAIDIVQRIRAEIAQRKTEH